MKESMSAEQQIEDIKAKFKPVLQDFAERKMGIDDAVLQCFNAMLPFLNIEDEKTPVDERWVKRIESVIDYKWHGNTRQKAEDILRKFEEEKRETKPLLDVAKATIAEQIAIINKLKSDCVYYAAEGFSRGKQCVYDYSSEYITANEQENRIARKKADLIEGVRLAVNEIKSTYE